MDINLVNSLNSVKQSKIVENKYNKFSQYNNLSPLKCDVISFSGMKKNQFLGLDLVIVEKFKAPIEKFNSQKDLDAWISSEINKCLNSAKANCHTEAELKAIDEWKNYVQIANGQYTPAEQLLIFDMITKNNSNKNNVNMPPVLNRGVLAELFSDIRSSLKNKSANDIKNYAHGFNLRKIYSERLKNFVMEEGSTGDNTTKWIVIPSKKRDPEHFEENVKKLQILSCNSWCTKTSMAKPYLSKGDFHLYVENGKTKVAVRFDGDEIQEIQGKFNNSRIPVDYYDEVESHISKGKYKLSNSAKKELAFYKEYEKTISYIRKLQKRKAIKGIFEHFGIMVTKDKNGMFILSHYNQPNFSKDYLQFSDFGIDENQLLSKVVKIKGDADFRGSALTSLGKIKTIGGNAIFSDSNIKKLGELTQIGGNAVFKDSEIENLGKLTQIGGDAVFKDSEIENLGELTQIGGNALFKDSEIENLGELTKIGGNVSFTHTKVCDLGKLTEIGGNANFNSPTNISDLKNLKRVGGNLDCSNPNLTNLGALEYIGGNAHFADIHTENPVKIKYIGGNANFYNTNASFDDLEHISGRLYIEGSDNINMPKLKHVEYANPYTLHRLFPIDCLSYEDWPDWAKKAYDNDNCEEPQEVKPKTKTIIRR